jgi:hypothetical protein
VEVTHWQNCSHTLALSRLCTVVVIMAFCLCMFIY